ncbi:BTAD domain-containing putative transcriptional regulator [Actinomadura sp. NEAU-AAG7]|uniref:ATP-binding protein n=1 Tax=Actinomadura sp. NEAU-AAG7 TaxID=2839640 RepID=UPI001BE499BB|nr:BTAD domain-containing putative transcriptional regulator [Actinomadura sp. NEAU-AAG7]MBT2210232.1 AfsR/SARP family transcriptional regulator [Actinomadura sp. NEAU-AAG7]
MAVELALLTRVACRGREITGPRLRDLLALLAAEPRAGVAASRLVEGLWPDGRPENPAKALQVVVSRARSQLGADVIASTPSGYRLSLAEDAVDASAVLLAASAAARSARDGGHAAALAHADAGLALWEGVRPEAPPGDDPVAVLRAARIPTYWTLLRARGLALSRLGRRAEAADALAALARVYPRDEEVLRELLRCEAATAGAAAALARYEGYRRALREDLGTDPGAALRAVHQELLRDAAPPVRRGVAHEPNPLLGREDDTAAVRALVRASRVTSIVGPGGLGKTRLANAVARGAEQRSVHLVPLAGVARDEDVAGEVASVLGAGDTRLTPGRAPGHAGPAPGGGTHSRNGLVSGIAEALGPGPALLVLDNCEHVVGGAADLVGALVSLTRDVRVLTTGRAPLGLSSESVYPLPELDLATAVELFLQRARAARPRADLPADAVEDICRHLDGLPLAVELAAARVRVMSVPEIARGLGDRFALLRGGARDAPSRHRTIHAVVDWSWALLDPSGRAAMRALSVFPGGFTAAAARHLVGGDVLAVLADLADQSLLKVSDTGAGARFRMLETVREFSAARLAEAGEEARAVDGLVAWAQGFGAAHHAALFGAEPFATGELVRAEQDNLQLALHHALDRRDGPAVAAVTAVLGCLWTVESAFNRLAALTADTAGALSRFRPGPEHVEVARSALTLCAMTGLVLDGPRPTRALVALRRLPPVPPTTVGNAIATVVRSLPEILGRDGAALAEMCASGEPLLAGAANAVAGYLHESRGDLDGAIAATERMVGALDDQEAPWMRMASHSRLGELYMQVDQSARAERHMRVALDVLEGHEAWADVIGLRWALAIISLQLGDLDAAERWLEVSFPHEADEASGTPTFYLCARAEIALARGDTAAGLALWRRAAEQLDDAERPLASADLDLDPFTLETHSAAVVAHARHGGIGAVEHIADGLPGRLTMLLTLPEERIPSFYMDQPVCGAVLLALALTDLARGREPARAARMIALAERLRFIRNFQPTMSAPLARRAAQEADGPAYADAVSEYAGLDRPALRSAALAVLTERG